MDECIRFVDGDAAIRAEKIRFGLWRINYMLCAQDGIPPESEGNLITIQWALVILERLHALDGKESVYRESIKPDAPILLEWVEECLERIQAIQDAQMAEFYKGIEIAAAE